MQVEGLGQIKTLDAAVVNYINEIKNNFEQKIQELNNQVIKYKNEAIEYQNKYIQMHDKYELLVYKRFARSAEEIPYDANQPFLFSGETEPEKLPDEEESAKDERTEVKSYTRNKPGRKPLDPKLPRDVIVIDIPDTEKICGCGAELVKIGEETSEKIDIIPMRVRVIKTVRPKYACRKCEGTEDEDKKTVRTAPAEKTMIPGSISTPGTLAAILTGKFEDHLPYARQEKMFERIGASISKQDMSNWQQHVYKKLKPLFDLLIAMLKSWFVLQMDETGMWTMSGIKMKKEEKEVQKPEERKLDINHGYMWLARGGPPDKKVIWYEYHESRAGKHAKEFLEGYSGYLQTDGYKGYDSAINGNTNIIHVGCFAHARRKFFEASKVSKNCKSAQEGTNYIRKLYELENELKSKKLSEEEFVEERKNSAAPILEKFKSWLYKRADEVNPASLLGTAVDYTLKQWDKLIGYLECCHLTPDNNACENAIRPFVVGRKNWMIAGSPEGAKSSCGIYTLIETAKQNGLEPFKYLNALFEKAPYATTPQDWEKLLPWNIEIQ